VLQLQPAVANYCIQGNSTASENIGSVDFNTISNTTSSGSGYVDYNFTNVSRGTAYTIAHHLGQIENSKEGCMD
jgi:hypothetical protein